MRAPRPDPGPPPGLPGGAAADLVEEVLTLGRREVRLLRPRDGDALLDEVLAEEDPGDERLPFWAELWPSGGALAAAVAGRDLSGVRVLELGCGLGLVSVAAAGAGGDVVAADQSAEAIAFTTVNADRNGVRLRTVRCAFERPTALLAEAPWDLVLAADVLYEPKNVPVLLGLLPRLVDGTGEVWVADPGRPRERAFLDGVDALGWHRDSRPAAPPVTVHRLRPPGRGPAAAG